jgi:ribulose-phosphate 3-epimerase
LNPDTPISRVEAVLEDCDLLLLMSVFPGFGGQSFCPEVLDKLSAVSSARRERGLELTIQIDGGVGEENAEELSRLGVDLLVAGSAVFGAEDPAAAFRSIQAAAARGLD